MGRVLRIREETYKKIETYAAARGTTKAGAVAILVTEALSGKEGAGIDEISERLESIEKKLNKLILLEMEK